jgi:hypothetical protein
MSLASWINPDPQVVGIFVQQRWFLSYHSPDHGIAVRLKEAIERKGSSVSSAATSLRTG